MKHLHVLAIVTITLALFFSACSGRPTDSIQRTEQERKAALAERADLFAPDYWNTAEKTMQEANTKLDAKDYGEAGNLLLRAKTSYTKAKELAQSKRENLIKTVNGISVTIGIRLKQDLLDNPLAAKLPPARKKEFDAKVKQVEDNKEDVDQQIDDYVEDRHNDHRTHYRRVV